jgi:NADPH:quinone reductase-like Zn-dependent oxidoreductase
MENRALWLRSFGRPADVLRLETARLPERPIGSLRVRLSAVPINPSDLIPITGAYRHRVFPPRVAGYEGLGTVVDTDEDDRALIGRRVLLSAAGSSCADLLAQWARARSSASIGPQHTSPPWRGSA